MQCLMHYDDSNLELTNLTSIPNVHFGGFSCPLNLIMASVWAMQLIKLLPVRTFALVHNVGHLYRLCYGNSIPALMRRIGTMGVGSLY